MAKTGKIINIKNRMMADAGFQELNEKNKQNKPQADYIPCADPPQKAASQGKSISFRSASPLRIRSKSYK